MIVRQIQHLLYLGVVEGADNDGTEPERDRLQVDILCDMAGFDVRVAARSLTVLLRAAFLNGRDDQHRRGTANPGLSERGLGQRISQVAISHVLEPVPTGGIAIEAGRQRFDVTGHQVKLQRVECAGGRGRPAVVPRRYPLRGPQELPDISERQRPARIFSYRPSLMDARLE